MMEHTSLSNMLAKPCLMWSAVIPKGLNSPTPCKKTSEEIETVRQRSQIFAYCMFANFNAPQILLAPKILTVWAQFGHVSCNIHSLLLQAV